MSVFEPERIFVCVSRTIGVIVFHLSTHTHTPPDLCQFLLSFSILTTLDQDPVVDPPKRDWLHERREFCLPSLSRFSPCSFSVTISWLSPQLFPPLLSVYFTLCLFIFPLTLFSPLSSCIWKHSTVGFTSTNTRLLPLGWILNARGSTKVQISFFRIVLLWNQTHCCFPLPFSGLRGCGECAHGSVEATAGHM